METMKISSAKDERRDTLTRVATIGYTENAACLPSMPPTDEMVVALSRYVDSEYIAKLAVLSREQYKATAVPAALLAVLMTQDDSDILRWAFPRVTNNMDMLRRVYAVVKSGVTGRKSFGSRAKRLMQRWFSSRTPVEIFEQSHGTPSAQAIMKGLHPHPGDKTRRALYGWMANDGEYNFNDLPDKVRSFEEWKFGRGDPPHVPFEFLTAQGLVPDQWVAIARRANVNWILKNLGNLSSAGAFNDHAILEEICEKLRDPAEVIRAKTSPCRVLSTLAAGVSSGPIREALQECLKAAVKNTPPVPDAVFVMGICGSTTLPFNMKAKSTHKFGYAHAAGITLACCLVAKSATRVYLANGNPMPLPLEDGDVAAHCEGYKNVFGGSDLLASSLYRFNQNGLHGDLVITCNVNYGGYGVSGSLAIEWDRWKARNPAARLVCLDMWPRASRNTGRPDVLNVYGWGERVFDVIARFASGQADLDKLTAEVQAVNLVPPQ